MVFIIHGHSKCSVLRDFFYRFERNFKLSSGFMRSTKFIKGIVDIQF